MSFLPSLLSESLRFFKGLFYWVSQNVHSRVDCHAFVHEGTLLYNFYYSKLYIWTVLVFCTPVKAPGSPGAVVGWTSALPSLVEDPFLENRGLPLHTVGTH